MLFSARITWMTSSELVIATGTAFGELVISCISLERHGWTLVSYNSKQIDDAHKGGIFGIDIIKDTSSKIDGRLILATCSDDRTIRLWSVDGLSIPKLKKHSATAVETIQLIAWTWAHASRIWQVAFASLSQGPRNSLLFFSAGEDASCQIFQFPSHYDITTPKIEHYLTTNKHAGKNIWAVSPFSAASARIQWISAGADGAFWLVSMHDYQKISPGISPSTNSARSYSVWSQEEKVRNFAWINLSTILILTRRGDLWLARNVLGGLAQGNVEFVQRIDDLATYSVVCGVHSKSATLVASSIGTVYYVTADPAQVVVLAQVSGKPIAVAEASVGTSSPGSEKEDGSEQRRSKEFGFFVSTLKCKTGVLHIVKELPSTVDSYLLMITSSDPITSLKIDPISDQELLILLGSRSGLIHVYQVLFNSADMMHSSHAVPSLLTIHAHEDAVTSMHWLRHPYDADGCGYLLCTSRDSTYSILVFESAYQRLSARKIHQSLLPFGPFIEGAIVGMGPRTLILHGFRGTDFVLYDEIQHCELASINCKGGHRSWQFRPMTELNDDRVGAFAWTSGGSLQTASFLLSQDKRILSGGHGREIKACAASPKLFRETPPVKILATGAEDTEIRLFTHPINETSEASQDSFQNASIIRKHTTGIQQLKWSQSGEYLLSSGGCEELFLWRIVSVPLVQLGFRCIATLPRLDESSPDLRVTDFDIIDELINSDKVRLLKICLALSDSTVRVRTPSFSQ